DQHRLAHQEVVLVRPAGGQDDPAATEDPEAAGDGVHGKEALLLAADGPGLGKGRPARALQHVLGEDRAGTAPLGDPAPTLSLDLLVVAGAVLDVADDLEQRP